MDNLSFSSLGHSVHRSLLRVRGFVIDSVQKATGNVMPSNIQSIVTSLSSGLVKGANSNSLWKNLIGFDPDEPFKCEYNAKAGFHDLLAFWSSPPAFAKKSYDAEEYENEIIIQLCRKRFQLGRNIFRLRDGLFGIGAMGHTDGGEKAVRGGDVVAAFVSNFDPVVLRRCEEGNGREEYTIVGVGYVGELGEAAVFKGNEGGVPELRDFWIR